MKCDKNISADKTETFSIPNRGGNVWPNQICPAFIPREGASESEKGCWYCRHADFRLNREKPLDVGTCEWPDKILK